MKIKIDKENRVVIAYGGLHGKRIRAVAVCKEPIFDENFGTELATKKFKIKERYTKLKEHESFVKYLEREKERINALIKDHNKCAEYLDKRIQEDIIECDTFVKNHFSE